MLNISDLTVTQCGFRNERQLEEMVAFVAGGGIFDQGSLHLHSGGKDIRPINIVQFEDGRHFIHDGHHRIAAIYLGGRKFILDGEYKITHWKYSDYLEINFELGWVTPFDPRHEVRIPDYDHYKSRVKDRLKNSKEEAIDFVRDRQAQGSYTRPRMALTVQDLLARA